MVQPQLAAQLLGNKVKSLSNLALWQLRIALEQNDTLEYYRVMVAALWIQHASEVLFELANSTDELSDGMKMALETGPRFQGDVVFSMDRWRFWKSRFVEATKTPDDDAAQAVELMGKAEAPPVSNAGKTETPKSQSDSADG